MTVMYAHTDPTGSLDHGQELLDHLTSVATRARAFAQPVGAGEWAYWTGMLHDAGKASVAFQRRLAGAPIEVDHATGGAQLAAERFPNVGRMLSFAIAGHHGGMPNWAGTPEGCHRTPLKERLSKPVEPFRDAYESLVSLPAESRLMDAGSLPNCYTSTRVGEAKERCFGAYLTAQMIFSSLVDADFLDTESFVTPDRSLARSPGPATIAQLSERLDAYMANLGKRSTSSPVNDVRTEVLRQCVASADADVGLFSLDVPTGGGKTLAALSFGLHHAVRNGQSRVIIAIPFTSIVEQTAGVLKRVFGAENVLEHHSNYGFGDRAAGRDSGDTPEGGRTTEARLRALRERLLVENWDAPIIVTTNVQLFESLFSNKTSKCRKVHNVANAVVILDEAQTLPDPLLRPTLAMIQALADFANTTTVFCTATPPNLESCWPFASRPRTIVNDRDGSLFSPLLGRVTYDCSHVEEDPLSLDDLAEIMMAEQRCLCVVSSQDGARRVYETLKEAMLAAGGADGLFHLSGRMIPQHRSELIGIIRRRLSEGLPCRVISTQLIEAGVDVDFPLVLREVAGIDSVIQAAGRCNREGRLPEPGRVVVFTCPEIAKHGKNWLNSMRDLGIETINRGRRDGFDPFGPRGVAEFFDRRYGVGHGFGEDGLDRGEIFYELVNENGHGRAATCEFSFERYANAYEIIKDDGVAVFVPWGEGGEALLGRIESGEESADLRRSLQRYSLSVPRWLVTGEYADSLRAIGPFHVLEMREGSEGLYSEELGLLRTGEGELQTLCVWGCEVRPRRLPCQSCLCSMAFE